MEVKKGEIIVVPRGVGHRPIEEEEVWSTLFEPKHIKHTGEVRSHLAVDNFEKT